MLFKGHMAYLFLFISICIPQQQHKNEQDVVGQTHKICKRGWEGEVKHAGVRATLP